MEGWTVERVNGLAPDSASLKAGQGLAVLRKWASVGMDEAAFWGECQGSGAKPYQVRVDLSEPAYKCSCPSRKFPCKHALGLLLLAVAGNVQQTAQPQWVAEWLTERSVRAEKKRERADVAPTPVDEKAQIKRKENRLERVDQGLEALKVWIHDLIRTGLAAVPSRGYGFFDEQARRLIDAQAPGVARRVQALASAAAGGVGWQRPFLKQLGSLSLLIRGFERRQALPQTTNDLLLNTIGVPRGQEEVLATTPIADRWQVIAQEVSLEDRLRVQQTWLLGQRSGERVVVLAFAHGTQPLDASLPAGFAFDGEIARYPGDRLRGLVKSRGDLTPFTSFATAGNIESLLDLFSVELAANPWLDGFVSVLAKVTLARTDEAWMLTDADGQGLRLTTDDATSWRLAALSGGYPMDVVARFDGALARPLGMIVDRAYVRLNPAETGGAA